MAFMKEKISVLYATLTLYLVSATPPKGNTTVIHPKTKNALRVSFIQMDKIENKMLIGNSIGGTLVRSVTGCKGNCARIPPCVSMNVRKYNATFLSCEFLDFDHYGVKERIQLIDAPDVDFYVLKVSRRPIYISTRKIGPKFVFTGIFSQKTVLFVIL